MRSGLQPALARSRTGCQTCRKRRKACDRVQPICGACTRLKLKCTYSMVLKWGDSRNVFINDAEHALMQRDTYDLASSAVNQTIRVRLRRILEGINASQDLQRTVSLTLCDQDREILLDFLTSGYRTLVAKFEINDGFIEFFNDCEQSFASLWSCLTYQMSMDKTRKHLFEHYYRRCLILFRKEISVMLSTGEHGAIWFVGMLLCGISANQLLPWTIHLNALITLLRSERPLENIRSGESDEGSREILQMLASYDIPVYVLNRKTPYHRLWVLYNLDLPGVEEECGLPCSLVDLLAQLDQPETVEALFNWQVHEEHIVQRCSWDATRYAAIIRAVEDFKAAKKLDIVIRLLARGSTLFSVVQSLLCLVNQCVLNMVPGMNHFKQSLMFPLVMAASQRGFLSDCARKFICSTIESFGMDGNYHLRQGALRVIEEHWINDADTIEETACRLDIELAMW